MNKFLTKNRDETSAVKVHGDSITGACIKPGDVLIVDRSLKAQSGNIIIASIFDEFTVKRLKIENGSAFLCPENPNYHDVKVTEAMDFSVWGVVTYIIQATI